MRNPKIVAEGTWNCCTTGELIHEQNRMNMIDGAKRHRKRSCTYRITMNSCASGRYYNTLYKTINSSRIRYTTRSEYLYYNVMLHQHATTVVEYGSHAKTRGV